MASKLNDRKDRDPKSIDTFEFTKSMRKLDKKLRSCRKLSHAFDHVQEFYELVKHYILSFKCDYSTFADRHLILFQVFENRVERWISEDVIAPYIWNQMCFIYYEIKDYDKARKCREKTVQHFLKVFRNSESFTNFDKDYEQVTAIENIEAIVDVKSEYKTFKKCLTALEVYI